MKKITRFNITYALIAFLGVILLHDLWAGYRSVTPLPYSEFKTLVREIDCAVRKNVLVAFERAVQALTENRDLLERSARLLLEKETLDTPDLTKLFADVKPAPEDFSLAAVPCSQASGDSLSEGDRA